MRKNFTVSLDKENVERLQAYLAASGMTFSGYLRGAVNEFVAALDNTRLPDRVEDLTLGEAASLVGRMIKQMKEPEKPKGKK